MGRALHSRADTLDAPPSPDTPHGRAAISAEGLRKSYGATVAVDGLDFTVGRGEVFGLLGPNGAGKTTTVEIIAGLRRPDTGRVRVGGLDPATDGAALKERVGLAVQRSELYPMLTVREILSLFGTFYRRAVPPDDLIALVELGEKRGSLVKTLSGGQRQRLAVALALVHDPDVLFLDEPTAGLDPQARRGLWETIARLRDTGKTILLTTHYLEEAAHLCDRVAIVDHGRIIALDRPAALVDRYRPEETIVFEALADLDRDALRALPAVAEVDLIPIPDRPGWRTTTLRTTDTQTSLRALLDLAAGRELALRGLRVECATLEDVFLHLTGRRIRD